MHQEGHTWILKNVADTLHAVSSTTFGLMVDGRIDGVPVVHKAYRHKMRCARAIRCGQMANAMGLYQSCQVVSGCHSRYLLPPPGKGRDEGLLCWIGVNVWSVVVCQSSRPVKAKTGILDVSAIACYNFIYQYKGEIYGR